MAMCEWWLVVKQTVKVRKNARVFVCEERQVWAKARRMFMKPSQECESGSEVKYASGRCEEMCQCV
jgi:hypothetical protein